MSGLLVLALLVPALIGSHAVGRSGAAAPALAAEEIAVTVYDHDCDLGSQIGRDHVRVGCVSQCALDMTAAPDGAPSSLAAPILSATPHPATTDLWTQACAVLQPRPPSRLA